MSDESCRRRAGARAMPDLAALSLRTDPRLHAGGFLIKGMYYAVAPGESPAALAFRLGCDGVLDPRPFLVAAFATSTFLLDADGDGCADGAGAIPETGLDPADYLQSLDPARRACAKPGF